MLQGGRVDMVVVGVVDNAEGDQSPLMSILGGPALHKAFISPWDAAVSPVPVLAAPQEPGLLAELDRRCSSTLVAER